jgi:3-hydroxyacyl-[acyl-carrier-protein] dehydratase
MSVAPNQAAQEEAPSLGLRPIFDLAGIDLTARLHGRDKIATMNPHRGDMALLDWIIWLSPDIKQGVGLKHTRDTEFWVPGHFPAKPMFPGVLMIEAGAQLACYMYNSRIPGPKVVAFVRIEDASFRASVQPGDDLLLLCSEVKFSRRRFISHIQGMVGDKMAFDARISGVSL